ncbi:CHASE2 domain-containing protein [Scytonema sp. UIC 10036]|uniref:sensor histidine kinase n=1 Tax=Scytonema sp. UIC 10036 TaxID=2304196 RepID=UPI0012DA29F9|nr:CHASE2 domain-containing protein [Scytonema sp. UIC 10036]MUG99583.1 CHASE2 domain-containing protein [Scytonema sp. UIC 10036]
MQLEFWKRIKEEITIWRVGALPGILAIALVMATRITGSMQSLEWLVFDSFLRLRPQESIDERIIIIGINEEDISRINTYPIPDKELAILLRKLYSLSPREIGLDIFRNLPVEPGHSELVTAFQNFKNVIAIEKVLPEQVPPPLGLPTEKVGFVDQIIDTDGKLRRSLLATPTTKGYKFSLSLKLATAYLKQEGFHLENGIHDENTVRFGKTEFPRFLSNSGSYVQADDGGVQVLLNFRIGEERFRTLTLHDIKTGNFQPEWIRDRIVIIGVVASSVKDWITTSTISSTKPAPGRVYGVEVLAHTTSQIISSVLDKRVLLQTWSEGWEYLWILSWGLLGIVFARLTKSPFINLLAVVFASINLVFASYIFLIVWGLWVPIVPTILVLVLNGFGMTALYQYDQALRSRMNAHLALIERTFETIHNGPLQTLAKTLKCIKDRDLPPNELVPQLETELEKLNYELRGIYEFLQQEPITQGSCLYLRKGLLLNLKAPIHEVLYQVYNSTLERDFPCFKTLRVKIRTFDPVSDRYLSVEQKLGLCRFLEEALCNVGKHAKGVTRLEVTCTSYEGWCTLSIVDNGLGINSSKEGRGTQQFRNLAKQLKGKYRRSPRFPKGTLCELSWPLTRFCYC